MNEIMQKHYNHLLRNLGESNGELKIKITGSEPTCNSPWHIGEAAATALSAMATLINNIYDIRTGKK